MNDAEKRLHPKVIAQYKPMAVGTLFMGQEVELLDRDSLLALIGWCGANLQRPDES